MSRLEPLDLDDLDSEQRALLEAMQQGPRGAVHGRLGLVGPFGVWLRSPKVGHAAQAFGAVVRFSKALPETVKEVAICTVGAHFEAKFEFAAHAALALAAGVPADAVHAIRDGKRPELSGAEALAWEIASTLLTKHRLSDAQYARARAAFGESELVELVTLIGYYCQISLTLNAFEVPITAAMEDPFPDVP